MHATKAAVERGSFPAAESRCVSSMNLTTGRRARLCLPPFKADFGQRAVDNFAEAHQTLAQNRPTAAVAGDGAPLERVEREHRRSGVSEFVSPWPKRSRLRVWNSSTEMRALCSTASAVIVWQMSP